MYFLESYSYLTCLTDSSSQVLLAAPHWHGVASPFTKSLKQNDWSSGVQVGSSLYTPIRTILFTPAILSRHERFHSWAITNNRGGGMRARDGVFFNRIKQSVVLVSNSLCWKASFSTWSISRVYLTRFLKEIVAIFNSTLRVQWWEAPIYTSIRPYKCGRAVQGSYEVTFLVLAEKN